MLIVGYLRFLLKCTLLSSSNEKVFVADNAYKYRRIEATNIPINAIFDNE
jgi:hypothetical protein